MDTTTQSTTSGIEFPRVQDKPDDIQVPQSVTIQGGQPKKCIYHRRGTTAVEPINQHRSRFVGSSTTSTVVAGSTTNSTTPTTSPSSSVIPSSIGGIPASTTGQLAIGPNELAQQVNGALIAERYLLLDLVDGNSMYKCYDVKAMEELVCKVSSFNFYYFLCRLQFPDAIN